MDHRATYHSELDSLGELESHSMAVQKECATPPLVHFTSGYVITREKFYSHVSAASDKCWGEKASV